jgi:hypothetical protein
MEGMLEMKHITVQLTLEESQAISKLMRVRLLWLASIAPAGIPENLEEIRVLRSLAAKMAVSIASGISEYREIFE